MNTPKRQRDDAPDASSSASLPVPSHSRNASHDSSGSTGPAPDPHGKPTYAAFSPSAYSGAPPISAAKRRSTILVHQKSPLLLATPPQVTRALAYSHPFLLPANKFVGLLSWTTKDKWESFLVVVAYWTAVLYGDVAIRYAAPLLLAAVVVVAMYGRRFSPLSTSGNDGRKRGQSVTDKQRAGKGKEVDGIDDNSVSEEHGQSRPVPSHTRSTSTLSAPEQTSTRHQKTLDEMVETLKEFTSRCNLLMEPLLELTDFLSTQTTPTSATTRPSLVALFIRLFLVTPIWAALTLQPLHIITTRRVMLVSGTVMLTWHAPVVKAGRTLLWRSKAVRRLVGFITGLQVQMPRRVVKAGFVKTATTAAASSEATKADAQVSELTRALKRARGSSKAGVKFTFILYENQRRWVGLGWTSNLFAYERAAWTDEHQNSAPSRDEFELPEMQDNSHMAWQWADGSRWRVDGVPDEAVNHHTEGSEEMWDYNGDGGRNGWVYYDNKWQNGRRGQDGWGRWTRRRKWYRDAELVEMDESDEDTTVPVAYEKDDHPELPPRPRTPNNARVDTGDQSHQPSQADEKGHLRVASDSASTTSTSPRPVAGRFRIPSLRRRVTDTNAAAIASSVGSDGSSTAIEHGSPRQSIRSRRTSDVASDDEALSPSIGVELLRQHARDQWGVGDEVRMSLE